MDHERAISLFSDYHDCELDEPTVCELESHLAECAKCNAEWKSFQAAISGVSGLMQISPAEDVVSSVQQKIRKRSAGKFYGKNRGDDTRFALISFILVLVFMMAYLLLEVVSTISIIESPVDTVRDSDSFGIPPEVESGAAEKK